MWHLKNKCKCLNRQSSIEPTLTLLALLPRTSIHPLSFIIHPSIIISIPHPPNPYTMNNPAITNMVISLGGMQRECSFCLKLGLGPNADPTLSRSKATHGQPRLYQLPANGLCRISGSRFYRLLLHYHEGELCLLSSGPQSRVRLADPVCRSEVRTTCPS